MRVLQYALRRGSGGRGARSGGDGLVREFQFLAPAHFTLLTERRTHAPWGIAGGGDAAAGRQPAQWTSPAGSKCERNARPGDRLRIETPGGGGCGAATA